MSYDQELRSKNFAKIETKARLRLASAANEGARLEELSWLILALEGQDKIDNCRVLLDVNAKNHAQDPMSHSLLGNFLLRVGRNADALVAAKRAVDVSFARNRMRRSALELLVRAAAANSSKMEFSNGLAELSQLGKPTGLNCQDFAESVLKTYRELALDQDLMERVIALYSFPEIRGDC